MILRVLPVFLVFTLSLIVIAAFHAPARFTIPGFNYCGPGNNGYKSPVTSELDQVCKSHDYCEWNNYIQHGVLGNCRCDEQFFVDIQNYQESEKNWRNRLVAEIFSHTIWLRKTIVLKCSKSQSEGETKATPTNPHN